MDIVATEWNMCNQSQLQEMEGLTARIEELQKDFEAAMDKIRVLSSASAIKFMKKDLVRIEQQIKVLGNKKAQEEAQQPIDCKCVLDRVKHFLEHLDEIVNQQIGPIKKAQLFRVIFTAAPTYEDLKIGTPKTPLLRG